MVVVQEKGNTGVYRLLGVGPGDGDVIAKRSVRGETAVERWIYEQCGGRLGVRWIECYGVVDDEDGESSWLFLECAEGEIYRPELLEHRVLAARWLGLLHTTAAGWDREVVPEKGSGWFRGLLVAGRAHLERCMGEIRGFRRGEGLGVEERGCLHRLLGRYAILERRWGEIEEAMSVAGPTLVHGDFLAKNLRVRRDKSGAELVVFDWEHAGWGSVMIDLARSGVGGGCWARAELEAYRDAISGMWPGVGLEALRFGSLVGGLMHLLVWIHGDAQNLDGGWISRPLARLAVYEAELSAGLRECGWEE